jgi:uncharacterized membrane protein
VKIKSDYYLPAFILLSSLMVTVAVYGEWKNPLRGILVFGFMLICPGMAFAHLLPGKDQITRFILVIGLSLALDTAIAEVVLYLGLWSPHLMLLILIGFCCLGIVLKLLAENFHQKSIDINVNNG